MPALRMRVLGFQSEACSAQQCRASSNHVRRFNHSVLAGTQLRGCSKTGTKVAVSGTSRKKGLQRCKILAQEPTLDTLCFFATLQNVQNRLIHDGYKQTFGGFSLALAGSSSHVRKPPLWLQSGP